jgi:hypothetical protein
VVHVADAADGFRPTRISSIRLRSTPMTAPTTSPRRSPARWLARAAVAAGLATALSGCIIVRDDDDCWDGYCDGYYGYYDDPYYDDYPDDQLDSPVAVDIDVGAQVGSVEPGAGAGVFVETDEAGHWRVTVACDTDVSGYECIYDLYLQADGITVDAIEELEPSDDFDAYESQVDVFFSTTNDFDGITFRTVAGAPLTLTMYLDGASQPELVYWVGSGVQNEGAPTNPIIFVPRTPDDV